MQWKVRTEGSPGAPEGSRVPVKAYIEATPAPDIRKVWATGKTSGNDMSICNPIWDARQACVLPAPKDRRPRKKPKGIEGVEVRGYAGLCSCMDPETPTMPEKTRGFETVWWEGKWTDSFVSLNVRAQTK